MEKYYMIWSDYDGFYVEEFPCNEDGRAKLEKRYTELAQDDCKPRYVLAGYTVSLEPAEIVTMYKVVR